MTLRIGTRIKKVRGTHAGYTGTVVGFCPPTLMGSTMHVRVDQGWINVMCVYQLPGTVCATSPDDWEPILSQPTSADMDAARELIGRLDTTELPHGVSA